MTTWEYVSVAKNNLKAAELADMGRLINAVFGYAEKWLNAIFLW